jgi:3,4-dihydroxy-9,10-secoandrosta-1,3,5(10)-triene-9,17-dione 4,5-dioxygenase
MTIHSLGYLGIGTPNPAAWARFAQDLIGLAVGEHPTASPSEGSYVLRMDQHPFRFWLEEAADGGVTVIGWEVKNDAALDDLVLRLKEGGVDVITGTDEECDFRQVARMVHFTGPCNVRTELFAGRRLAKTSFVSPLGVDFVTEEQGLGHLVMKTPHLDDAVRFYRDVLGFRLTDMAEYPAGTFVFLGCNPRHHSLAFVRSHKREGTHHILCQVTTPDDVGRALDRVREQRLPLMATLGKHANDGMFSFYVRSPSGFGIEIGAGGIEVDERTWVSRTFTADVWGHHPAE